MPRAKCDGGVFEHRLTLGTYERAELKKVVKAEKVKDYAQAAAMFTPIIGFGLVGAGIGFAGYRIAQALAGFCSDGIPPIEFGDELDDGSRVTLEEVFFGRKTHTFNNSDGSQTVYKNHFKGTPLGMPASVGINLGRALSNVAGLT
jgi:hypothetical protein